MTNANQLSPTLAPGQQNPKPEAPSLRRALRLEILTLAWMVTEAGVSIAAGIAARSLLLVAFGADSIIELLSAGVVLQRIQSRAASGTEDDEELERLEARAGRTAGWLLYLLAIYVVGAAAFGFARGAHTEMSIPGLAVAVVAAIGMPVLARAKLKVANELGSRALRADAMESITCGYLSWILLGGLLVRVFVHWSWLDPAASLLIVPFLLREAREAMTGECCDHCH